jgi:alkylation response protein AidB-like acyl-CoA dehydrogenase
LRPIAAEWDEREAYPPDLLAKAAHAGLTSYAIPADYGVEKWMRDAKVLQVVEGTSEIQRQIVTTCLKGGSGDRQTRG